MFKNVGKKVKGLALFFFWLAVICIVIVDAAFMAAASFSTAAVLAGILLGSLTLLIFWISTWALYALGQAADCGEQNAAALEALNARIASLEAEIRRMNEKKAEETAEKAAEEPAEEKQDA